VDEPRLHGGPRHLAGGGEGDPRLALRRHQRRPRRGGPPDLLGAASPGSLAGPQGQPLSLRALRRDDGRREGLTGEAWAAREGQPWAATELDSRVALLPPLLGALEALAWIGRHANPYDVGPALAQVGEPETAILDSVGRLGGWPERLAPLRERLEAASE